jgi:hypothetical protein
MVMEKSLDFVAKGRVATACLIQICGLLEIL